MNAVHIGPWVSVGADAPDRSIVAELEALLPPIGGDRTPLLQSLTDLSGLVRRCDDPSWQWSILATIAAHDLTVARAVEPHIDALSILDEARSPLRHDAARYRWGVYAAEGGTRLEALDDGDGWLLSGRKSWCSLARSLDRALITAWQNPQDRRLFAIDLAGAGITVGSDPWVARGLVDVDSPSLFCTDVPACAVGPEDWYFTRPGFAAGGIRVAAVWYGAAVGIGRTLRANAGHRELDQIGRMHLGSVDAALHRARCVLVDAARRLAVAAHPRPEESEMVALHARRTVRDATEEILECASHALGPAPLVRDAAHAARVADLTVYLCQEHGERDRAQIGSLVAAGAGLVL